MVQSCGRIRDNRGGPTWNTNCETGFTTAGCPVTISSSRPYTALILCAGRWATRCRCAPPDQADDKYAPNPSTATSTIISRSNSSMPTVHADTTSADNTTTAQIAIVSKCSATRVSPGSRWEDMCWNFQEEKTGRIKARRTTCTRPNTTNSLLQSARVSPSTTESGWPT